MAHKSSVVSMQPAIWHNSRGSRNSFQQATGISGIYTLQTHTHVHILTSVGQECECGRQDLGKGQNWYTFPNSEWESFPTEFARLVETAAEKMALARIFNRSNKYRVCLWWNSLDEISYRCFGCSSHAYIITFLKDSKRHPTLFSFYRNWRKLFITIYSF